MGASAIKASCWATVLPASCAIGKVVPFLVLFGAAKAAALRSVTAAAVVLVEAFRALDCFRLRNDSCSSNGRPKDL